MYNPKHKLYASRTCENCSISFMPNVGNQKLCPACHFPKCEICGKSICFTSWRYKKTRQCLSCSRKIFFQTHRGYNWKGGKVLRPDGYTMVYQPNHLRASPNGYVLEHILIWERINNKPLPKGWVIHHLNGIRDDNRPINLVALTSHKHFLVLQVKAKRIQELEAQLNNQGHLL